MNDTPIRVYYDFVDPFSWLLSKQLASAPEPLQARLEWTGFELRPPPVPLTDLDDPEIAGRWQTVLAAIAGEDGRLLGGDSVAPPRLVPWTRKAHEAVLHAGEHDLGEAMRRRIFEAYVHEGTDIGRIDRLVELAAGLGLDRSNTRAVLDVDRFDHAVLERRTQAASNGITVIPVVEANGERLTGFHDAALLRTFLGT